MSQNSSNRIFAIIIWIVAILAVIKLMWTTISYLYLPDLEASIASGHVKKSLYYRYNFDHSSKPSKISTIKSTPTSMKDVKLIGIYSSKDICIVTLIKNGKSHILSRGDKLGDFILKNASANEAYFENHGKQYVVKLSETKTQNNSSIRISKDGSIAPVNTKIILDNGIRQIPRDVIKTYTNNMSNLLKDIDLRPITKDGQAQLYKVRFIRAGSPFSELGLQAGDIIKAINGEEIVDLASPMELLKNLDTVEGITLTVIRNNKEKDLEYEIK